MNAAVSIPMEELESFCARHHIRKLAVFGSVLRDDFTADSDVDLLIEFEPGERVGFFRLYQLQEDLGALIGHRVDLCTRNMLSPYFRDRILEEAEELYVSAR